MVQWRQRRRKPVKFPRGSASGSGDWPGLQNRWRALRGVLGGFDSHALPPSSQFYVGFRPPSCPSPNCLQSQRPARDCPPMRGAPSRDTNTMRYLLRIAPFQMNHVRPAHEQRPGQRQAFGLGHRYTGLLETGAKGRCCISLACAGVRPLPTKRRSQDCVGRPAATALTVQGGSPVKWSSSGRQAPGQAFPAAARASNGGAKPAGLAISSGQSKWRRNSPSHCCLWSWRAPRYEPFVADRTALRVREMI
jgi:hypothetical protein